MRTSPPKFVTSLFKWFCKGDFYEELQGDLEEKFHEHVTLYGQRKAKYIYQKEILKMLRPSVVRTPKLMSSITRLSLFKIHLKLALRNVYRNRLFSTINIFGLGAALATSLFVVNMFYSSYRADRQHEDASSIYRIVTVQKKTSVDDVKFATTQHILAKRVADEIPEADIVSQVSTFEFTIPSSIEEIKIEGILVDDFFFDLFNFKVIDGNPTKIFNDPTAMIITEDIADRFFANEDPIGQITPQGFVIQAVVKSPKGKSHIQFDAIASSALHKNNPYKGLSLKKQWAGFPIAHTYIKLKKASNPADLQAKLDIISEDVNELIDSEGKVYQFKAQSILDIMFGDTYFLELGSPLGASGFAGFAIPIIILLALACFNYTNLSIARALQRTKEIGIRKTVGSSRTQVSGQFLTESVVFSLFALAIGYLIYLYFMPAFIAIDPNIAEIFSKEMEWQIGLLFIVFSIITGLIAGAFPALYYSRISPLTAFNSRVKSNPLSIINIRKVLITLQISLSMVCIILVSVNSSQNAQVLAADLGFNTENILIVRADSIQKTRYQAALAQIPEVLGTSNLSSLPGKNPDPVTFITDLLSNDSTHANIVFADSSFEKLFEPTLHAGAGFDMAGTNPSQMEALVNKQFLLNIHIDADSILGRLLTLKGNQQSIVVKGVLEDGVFDSPMTSFNQPLIVLNQKNHRLQKYMALKVKLEDLERTMNKLEQSWNESNPDADLNIQFLSKQIENSYREMQSILGLITFITTIVIGISILGQLGMALYNAQTKIKEISIRKVLGARFQTIIILLLKGTIISLIIATLIAIPLAYTISQDMVRSTPKTPFSPGLYEYFRAIMGLSALIILVVVSQTGRVARLNPAETLKND